MQRTETKTAFYVKCDFCGREDEFESFARSTMRHFTVSYHGIEDPTFMDICVDCEAQCLAWDVFEKARKLSVQNQAKEQIQQPHNADVEEWRR